LYGNINAFVTQLDADGTDLLYSTFLGGSNRDYANAVAVDSAGAAYIVGQTYSGDFPTTPDAFQYDLHGTANAFVVELASDGSTLLYSTYLGGNFADGGTGLTLDSGGNAVVVGDTISKDFPTTDGAFQTELLGDAAVFVSKVEIPGFGPRTSASARAQRDRSPISEEILPGILPSRPWPVPSPFDTIAVTVTEPDQLERWNAGLGILLDSPDTPRPKPHASCPTLQDGRKLPWSGDIACWLLSACFLPED